MIIVVLFNPGHSMILSFYEKSGFFRLLALREGNWVGFYDREKPHLYGGLSATEQGLRAFLCWIVMHSLKPSLGHGQIQPLHREREQSHQEIWIFLFS